MKVVPSHDLEHVSTAIALVSASASSPQFSEGVEHQDAWSRRMVRHPARDRKVGSIINRYYDPTTDQFLSIDLDVACRSSGLVM